LLNAVRVVFRAVRVVCAASAVCSLCAACAAFPARAAAPSPGAANTAAGRAGANAGAADADGAPGDGALEAMTDAGHWITVPTGGVIPVIGVASRRVNRDEAIAFALLDAAGRAALYFGVSGSCVSTMSEGSGNLDYYAATEYILHADQDAESIVEILSFDPEHDVFERDGSIYVLAALPAASDFPSYRPEPETAAGPERGAPAWTAGQPPEIPGYMTAAGVSRNKGSPQKTCAASWENAVVSLLQRLSTTVETSDMEKTGGGRLTQTVTVSEGRLSGVVILETWFDRTTAAVWTLIAAKEP